MSAAQCGANRWATRRFTVAVVVMLVGLAGCLPSSRRGRTNSLLPSDSLSRRIAAAAPVDTLERVWASAGAVLELPTSIAWMPPGAGAAAGRLVVTDTRAGVLRLFDAAQGSAIDAPAPREGLAFPYVAGVRGDTVVVLLRGEDRLAWLRVDGGPLRIARSLAVPAGATAALVTETGMWAKRADEYDAWLVRLDASGGVASRYPLEGPSWRRIGFLRARGDSVLSLSGYRPVVDVLPPSAPAGRAPDTLALVGFDSPQLLRSHRYIRGEVDQPPLLTSAAAAFEGHLYVVNLRVDQLRIDVFGPEGRLERGLVLPAGAETQDHFPVDLALRRVNGQVYIALVMQSPGGLMSDPGGYVLMLRRPGAGPVAPAGDPD